MEEQSIAFASMIQEFDSIFVLVYSLDFQYEINFGGHIALLNSFLLIRWLSQRSPPGDKLKPVGLEEVIAPVTEFFDSVLLKVSKLSLNILLNLSVGCRLEGGAFAALINQPVRVHIEVADHLAALVDHKLS